MWRIPSIASILLLAACTAVGPDYAAPETAMPAAFTAELDRGLVAGPTDLAAWWQGLGDPALDRLVAKALAANLDLRAALARIDEARARTGTVSRALRVDASTNHRRRQNSQELPGGQFLPRETGSHDAAFDASWEIDLWGRIQREQEAADAELEAALADRNDVQVIMIAETAINYVELRGFQERLRIARANVDIQARTVELAETRFASGLVSGLDVAQARTSLESSRATIPPLEAGVRAAANRLAVLTGAMPGSLEESLKAPAPVPVGPASLAVGVPADLLRRRADIRGAERRLAAQTARIGMAEADLYPRLRLIGNIGLSADDFLSMFSRPAAVFSFGPSLDFNVFDRDRLHAAVAVADAREQQSLIAYEKTVLLALEEVENAMTVFVREQVRRDALERAVAESRRAVDLASDQYREGLVDFQGVLESQRALFALEDQLTLNRQAISTAMIRVYKALGGGWDHEEPEVATPADDHEEAKG